MTKHVIQLPINENTIEITGPTGPFGEVLQGSLNPQVQLDPLFGLRTSTDVETFSALGGTTTAEDTGSGYEWKCTSGNSQYSYGLIRSRRNVRYRPGQGSVYRFTARYSSPVTGNTQRAGAFNTGSELTIGYNTDQQFGIMRRYGGKLELRRLTINNAASGAETVTVTLNGVGFNVAVTAGTTAANAHTISLGTFTGWRAYQTSNTILFVAESTGSKANSYTVSSTGTLTGTFAQVAAGATETDVWAYQNAWNIDKLDGTGKSGIVLDPTKGNVFQIKHQYLGYGTTTYSIVDPSTSRFIPFHIVKYPNANVSPNLSMPIMKMGYFTYNESGSTGTSIYGASMSGFTHGEALAFRNPEGFSASQTGIGTSYTSIFSIRVRPEFNGVVNLAEMLPMTAFVAAEGTKPSEIQVIVNGTFTGTPNWQYINQTGSIAEYNNVSRTYTEGTGRIVAAMPIAKSGSTSVDLAKLRIRLNREDVISIVAKAASGTVDVTGALIWQED